LGENAYLLDLPLEFDTSLIFNVNNLCPFHGTSPILSISPPTLDPKAEAGFKPTFTPIVEEIDYVFDVQEFQTRLEMHQRYLIVW